MTMYRKKPVVINATQWLTHGDHPHVVLYRNINDPEEHDAELTKPCKHCSQVMHVHGWIDTLEGGHIVCPSDYVITGVKGEMYPCKPDIFAATYDPA